MQFRRYGAKIASVLDDLNQRVGLAHALFLQVIHAVCFLFLLGDRGLVQLKISNRFVQVDRRGR
ncbi:hypothetical protein D3C85_1921250 [compost metagenome]